MTPRRPEDRAAAGLPGSPAAAQATPAPPVADVARPGASPAPQGAPGPSSPPPAAPDAAGCAGGAQQSRRLRAVPPPANAMSEDILEARMKRLVADLRKRGGRLLAYHTHDSRRSAAGFPDWCFSGPGGTAFRELKRQAKDPTPAQQEWLDQLNANGGDADVWKPSDLLSGRVARELAVWSGVVLRGGA